VDGTRGESQPRNTAEAMMIAANVMATAIVARNAREHRLVAAPPATMRLGLGVLEVVSDHRGDTFRSVYTVRFADRVVVLHAFQRKSRSGIATPKADIELITQRLKQAIEINKNQKKE